MKLKKRLVGFMLAAALTAIPVAFASCVDPSTEASSGAESNVPSDESSVVESLPFEQTGSYYCETETGTYALTLTATGAALVMGDTTLTATYTYDGVTLTLALSNGETATATYKDGTLAIKIGNKNYLYYANVNYTVSFETNGGSAVESVEVLNGKAVAKPEEDPTKEDYWFVGWYSDEACTQLYDFESKITGNTKLYARFVEKVEGQEFDVAFVVDGEEAYTMKTRGGVIYNSELPVPEKDGAEFLGWWTSAYGDENKLTCQYNEQQLGQHTTLYAVWKSAQPVVSVDANGVSWTAVGGSTYEVSIKNAKGNKIGGTVGPETSYAFDFSEWEAGSYTVEVSVLGASEEEVSVAYYQNKALDKICFIEASDDRVLTFNEVKGAEKYLITIVCGDENHTHTQIESTTPAYDFSDCQMQVGGITFKVEAVAEGYITSVSDEYSFERNLATLTGLKIDEATEIATWDAVENADAYIVEVVDNGNSLGAYKTTETSVSLRGLTGSLEVKVYPVSRDYNSSEVQSATFQNIRLAIPGNLALKGHSLVWDAVEGATGYVVKVGEATYEVSSAELVLLDEHFTDNVSVLSVQAVCGDKEKASLYSDSYTVRADNKIDEASLAYRNGTFSWSPVLGAAKYEVVVDENEPIIVEDLTQASIVFAAAGETKIAVRCYNAQEEASDWAVMYVDVYTLTFEAEGGVHVDPLYKAEGDSVTLPETSYRGYTFAGWYDIPDPLVNNGKVYETNFFAGAEDLVLYAGYTPNKYKANLDLGTLGVLDVAEAEVYYNRPYQLPVPECTDVTKVFAGWFSEPNNAGIQYTDIEGTPKNFWLDTKDVTLYAGWYNVLKFELVGTEQNKGYAVSKDDDGIRYVEHLTIPATYAGLPVIMVESGAFAGCTNLKTVKIPDTVQSIFISSDDKTDTGSSFESCTRLERVDMYCADSDNHATHEVFYESDEVGALMYNNPATGKKEFRYLPEAYRGEYEIPYGVEVIPTSAFFKTKLTKITIPASVTQIDSSAFASCELLTELVFLAAPEGEEEKELSIANGVFKDCNSLTELNLPARVTNLNLDIFSKKLQRINVTGNAVDGAEEEYYSIDGVLCQNNEIIYVPKGKTGAYRIPGGIYSIATEAFRECDYITAISIPSYVSYIGKSAFLSCDNIRSLRFEGGENATVLDIDESAFYSCSGLTEVTLPEHINKVAKNAFGNTKLLKTVTVLGDCANFELGAFADNSGKTYNVTTLILGENVQNVEIAGVFGTKLNDVTVDPKNDYITAESNVLYALQGGVKTELLYYPATRPGAFEIPATVTKIGANVFRGKTNLTAITIPASVTEIGDYAFTQCSNLKDIVWVEGTEALTIGECAFYSTSAYTVAKIPARVTSIGKGAFAGNKYTEIIFEEGDLPLTIGDYAFKPVTSVDDLASTTMLTGSLVSCVFPQRLVSIGVGAFHGAYSKNYSNAHSVTIPEGVTEIGNYAFAGNYTIKSVSLPASLTKMGAYTADKLTSLLVFNGCSGLETITVAEGNTAFIVKDGVFYGLTEGVITDLYFSPVCNQGTDGVVDIPKTVTKIWENAFASNKYIQSVTFSEGIDGSLTLGANVFKSTEKLANIQLPTGMTAITENMFQSCDSLVAVTVPYTVTSIAVNAFNSCDGLTEIKFAPLPEGVSPTEYPLVFADGTTSVTVNSSTNAVTAKVTKSCFSSCPKLTKIELPERTTKIGKGAFYNLNLTEVTIPSTVKEIGVLAFYKCDALETLNFAEDGALVTISDYAFRACSALKEVSIPSSVTTISTGAFVECTSLTTVNFAEGLETIKASAFESTDASMIPLVSLAFPASLKTIEKKAFYLSETLTTVTFAEGSQLTTIGESAFETNKVLSSIAIPASVTTIGKSAFNECISLASVTFAEEGCLLKEISDFAFGATAVKNFVFPTTASALKLGASIFALCEVEEVTLSASVAKIDGVFDDIVSLGYISVAEDNENFSEKGEGQQILMNRDKTAIVFIYYQIVGEFVVDDGVALINDNLFAGQSGLTKVTLPVSLKEIGASAFKGCTGLEEIVFLKEEGVDHSLTEIGASAFEGCTALKSVAIPENVTSIGNKAFYGCTALTSIELNAMLGQNKGTVGTDMFVNAGNNAHSITITLPEGLTKISNNMFKTVLNLKEITIPSTVESIGEYAFASTAAKTKLESVTFALADEAERTSALTSIGKYAFQACAKLTTVSVPNSVTTFGDYVFTGCTLLTEAQLPDDITKLPNGLFTSTGFTSYTIPETVTEIGNYVFQNSKLTSLVIPARVTKIGSGAFQNSSALKTLTFEEPAAGEPKVDVEIGANAFAMASEANSALTTINFSSQITSIGNTAFKFARITSLNLPASVETLGNSVFESCTLMTTAELGGLALKETWGTSIFNKCKKLNKVTLREGTKSLGGDAKTPFLGCTSATFNLVLPSTITQIPKQAFKTATSTGVNIATIDLSNITKIGDEAFKNCQKLANVTWGDSLTNLGKSAFENCTVLKTADISSVTSFGTLEFKGCTGLTEAVLPSDITTIGASMFYGCTKLETVNIPETVTEIGASAFYNCKAMTFEGVSVAHISKIGASAFYGCESLVSIDISSVTTLNSSVFQGCISLASVKLSDDLSSIGSTAFKGCTALKQIDLPENLSEIKNGAFAGSGLTSIVIPQYVTVLGNSISSVSDTSNAQTFQDCVDLERVTLPEGFEKLGGYIFKNCTSLKYINLPETMVQIGKEAFKNTALTYIELPASIEVLGVDAFNGCGDVDSYSIANSNPYFRTLDGALYAEQDIMSGTQLRYSEGLMIAYPLASIPESGILTLPEGATGIAVGTSSSSVFSGCDNLKEIVFPSTMTEIGKYAFSSCASLERVVIPETIMSIGGGAFFNCTGITELIFEGDSSSEPLEFKDNLSDAYFGKATSLESVTLSGRLRVVPKLFGTSYATAAMSNLKTVVLEEGIEEIAASAFRLTGITSIEFPSTLTTIGKEAFRQTKLTAVPDLKNVTTIGDSAFMEIDTLESATLTAEVTGWGAQMFRSCKALKTVEIEPGVTEIPYGMFWDCYALKSITLPDSVKKIGGSAFQIDTSRDNSGTTIKYPDFASYGLTSIDLGRVESIGANAFRGAGLTSITIPDTVKVLTDGTEYNGNAYSTLMPANQKTHAIFANCEALAEVILPEGLLAIGGSTFQYCTSLKNIYIPRSVKAIASDAFYESGLEEVEILNPDILLYKSFEYATSLKKVTLPEGLKALGAYTFFGCNALTEVNIPSTVTTFASLYENGEVMNNSGNTFGGNNKSTNASGQRAPSITRIVIPAGVKEIPDNAFKGCAHVTELIIPEGVETIGQHAFYQMSAVESVVIPSTVTMIEMSAFSSWAKTATIYTYASEAYAAANWASNWVGTTGANVIYGYKPVEDAE